MDVLSICLSSVCVCACVYACVCVYVCVCGYIIYYVMSHKPYFTGPGSSVGIVSAPGNGGHGFDPGPRHTKVVKNGTSCSSLGTQTYRVELGLVVPVSV